MFGVKALPTLVYRFGAFTPKENADEVRRQIRVAHDYKNHLTAQERLRRDRCDQVMRAHFPELVEAEANKASVEHEIEIIKERTNVARGRARKRIPMPPADKALMAQFNARLREIRKIIKALRADAYGPEDVKALRSARSKGMRDGAEPSEMARINRELDAARAAWYARVPRAVAFNAAMEPIEEEHNAEFIAYRNDLDLYWTTKGSAEYDMRDRRKDAPPAFRFWRGDGRIGGQVMAPTDKKSGEREYVTPERLFSGQSTMIQLHHRSGGAGAASARKRKRRLCECWLRIGSDGKEPLWTKFDVIVHRDPPSDCHVTGAFLTRRMIAGRERWALCLVLARRSGWQKSAASSGTIGIDVGWRRTDAGLRVAYGTDAEGRDVELVLPTAWMDSWTYVRELASQRSIALNSMHAELSAWIKCIQAPEWLNITHWKAPSRFARLFRDWQQQRFDGDSIGFEILSQWHALDLRRWREERNLGDKLIAHRTDVYRNFARRIALQYQTVVLEDFDLSKVERRPRVEADDPMTAARHNKALANIQALRTAFEGSGATIEWRVAAGTSMRCNFCGWVHDFDRAPINVVCPSCGGVRDQDKRAAVNLVERNTAAAGS